MVLTAQFKYSTNKFVFYMSGREKKFAKNRAAESLVFVEELR